VILVIQLGMLTMSRDVDGLVETSTNLTVVELNEGCATTKTSQHSSIESIELAISRQAKAVMELAVSKTVYEFSCPGWTPNMESVVLARLQGVCKGLLEEDIEGKAVHAKLECGILS
jgi:dipeptidase D